MKRVGTITLAALILFGFAVPQLSAFPLFKKEFAAKYTKKTKNKKFAAAVKKANCKLCHWGRKKSNRNDYGKALEKAGFSKKWNKAFKKEPAKVRKQMLAAFEKAAKMKNAKKKTFGALIKAGKLPGTAPKKKK